MASRGPIVNRSLAAADAHRMPCCPQGLWLALAVWSTPLEAQPGNKQVAAVRGNGNDTALSGRRTIICAIVGRLSSCAPIHRRSMSALVSSKRPVETGQQDKSCPTIAQIIVYQVLRREGHRLAVPGGTKTTGP